MKKFSTLLAIRKMQIKTAMQCHSIPTRMAIIKTNKQKTKMENKCWQGYGEVGSSVHYWCEYKMAHSLWKALWRFLKKLNVEVHFWVYTSTSKNRKQGLRHPCSMPVARTALLLQSGSVSVQRKEEVSGLFSANGCVVL